MPTGKASLKIENTLLNEGPLQSKSATFEIFLDGQINPIIIKKALVVPTLNVKYQHLNLSDLKSSFDHLKNTPLKPLYPEYVKLIVRTDSPKLLLSEELMDERDIDPHAVKTYLGWRFMGENKRPKENVSSNLTQTFIIGRFWEIESYGTVSKNKNIILIKKEKWAYKILKNTIAFKQRKYEIGLLWKKGEEILP